MSLSEAVRYVISQIEQDLEEDWDVDEHNLILTHKRSLEAALRASECPVASLVVESVPLLPVRECREDRAKDALSRDLTHAIAGRLEVCRACRKKLPCYGMTVTIDDIDYWCEECFKTDAVVLEIKYVERIKVLEDALKAVLNYSAVYLAKSDEEKINRVIEEHVLLESLK